MSRKLSFDEEALENMYEGVYLLSKAVQVTLGPKGRNVLMPRSYGAPHLSKDGITVAKEVQLSNPIAQMAADLVKEAANNTLEKAGDGTTSTTVLTHAIFKYGMLKLNDGSAKGFWNKVRAWMNPESDLYNTQFGSNAMDIKRGIDLACAEVVNQLTAIRIPVKSSMDIFNVAKISGNNDDEIGRLISEAVEKVGHNGVIQLEDSATPESSVRLVEGLNFDRGFLHPKFATNKEESKVEYSEPYYFLYSGVLSNPQDVLRSIELTMPTGKPLIIIAEDIDVNVMNFILRNRIEGQGKLVAIKAPGMGDQRNERLRDLAALTGCRTLGLEKYNSLTLNDLGTSERITSTKSSTTIISNGFHKELVDERLNRLRIELEECDMPGIKEKLETRIAQLEGKLSIISIGAPTEPELKEKKDRIDDAVAATKSAIEEGIVPGSGLALLRISQNLSNLKHLNKDIQLGIDSVIEAIKIPAYLILENAGLNAKSIITTILKNESSTWGFNSLTEKYVDLLEAGVIDPVKVTRLAVQNASSIAGMLLTTGCIISKDIEVG